MKKTRFFVLFLLFSLLYTACDVGLGSAVDTEPPILTIDYPSSASVIRDSFILAGTCKDDVKVTRVAVTVRGLSERDGFIKTVEADEIDNKENYWQVELNSKDTENPKYYNGWEFADGKYSLEVQAYDDSGRVSGTSSIAVIIDNTAPLMILKTPGGQNFEAPTEFGTSVKMAGTIVEDNEVSKVVMKAYDPDSFENNSTEVGRSEGETELGFVKKFTQSNVSVAGGVELTFASEGDGDGGYDILYPNNVTGDKKYKLEYEVYDNAREYKNPKDPSKDDTTGNKADKFFFSDDVDGNEKWTKEGIGYKTVQKIINGTYSGSLSDDEKQAVKDIFYDSAKDYAACLINKDASPKYSVLGFDVSNKFNSEGLLDLGNIPSATSETSISIQAMVGRNNDYIEPSTLIAYQMGPFNNNFVSKDDVKAIRDSITSNKPTNDSGKINYDNEKEINFIKLIGDEVEEKKKEDSSSSESYTYTVKAQNIEEDKVYLIVLVGKDKGERDLVPSGKYLFKGTSNNRPPVVYWPNEIGNGNSLAADGYTNKNNELQFAGTYDTTAEIEEAKYTVVIKGENKTATPVRNVYEGDVTLNKTEKQWSLNLSNFGFTPEVDKEYLYEITVTLINAAGEGSNTHKYHVDTLAPNITFNNISPIIEKVYDGGVTKNVVNGLIKFGASVEESNLENVEYKVYYDENGVQDCYSSGKLGQLYSINKDIDTRDNNVKDKHDFKIAIIATDKAGNETVVTSDSYNGGNSLYLDQATDVPVLSPNNFEIINIKESIKDETNVFDSSTNKYLLATITDDDLITNVKIEYYDAKNTAELISSKENTLGAKSTSSYSLKEQIPDEVLQNDGIYNVKITACDNDGCKNYTEIGNFLIGIDTARPVITETVVGEEKTHYVRENTSIEYGGTVSDKWEVTSLKAYITKNKERIGEGKPIQIGGNGEWSYNFNASEYNNEVSSYNIVFEVTDRAGKTSQIVRNVDIDTAAPSINSININAEASFESTIFTPNERQWVKKLNNGKIIAYDVDKSKQAQSDSGANYWYNQNQLPIIVDATDEGSEISSVEWSTDFNVQTNSGSWSSLAKGEKWTGTASCNIQGANTIWIKVKDAAGNESIGQLSVNVDSEIPNGITNTWVKGTEGVRDIYVTNEDDVDISVMVEDASSTCSGIGMVYYKYDDTYCYATKDTQEKWTLTIPKEIISRYIAKTNVKLTLVDKAGNQVNENVVTIQKDLEAPTTTIKSILDADDATPGVQVNGTITISGIARDNTVLKSVTLEIQKEGEDWEPVGTISTENNRPESEVANWNFTIDTTQYEDGLYKFRALVLDGAGNASTKANETDENEITLYIDQDSDRPVIHLTNLELTSEDAANNEKIYLRTSVLTGYVTDDDGISELQYKIGSGTWQDVTLEVGNSWKINLDGVAEGANTILFRVKDTVNEVYFTSGNASSLNRPKITDGNNTYKVNACDLNFNLVLTDPEVTNVQYSVGIYNGTNWLWLPYSDQINKVGGVYKAIKIKFNARSANEIDYITASLNGKEPISFTCQNSAQLYFDATAANEWISGAIPVGPEETPTIQSLKYTVYDKAGRFTERTINVSVDNTPPVVTISNPSILVRSEETIRGSLNEDVTLYWAVSRKNIISKSGDTYVVGRDYELDEVQPIGDTSFRTENGIKLATKWTAFTEEELGNNWFLYFDGNTDVNLNDHTKKLADYLTENELSITTKNDITSNKYTLETSLYVWIKAVDTCQNETIICKEVKIDPQGERPAVQLSYPVNVNNLPPKLSGTIPLSGMATDNKGAKYVWIQIDSDGEDGFGREDLRKLNEGSPRNYRLGQISQNKELSQQEIQAVIARGGSFRDYGIMIDVTGQAWNISINSAKEFNPPASSGGIKNLNLTIYATDEDKNISTPITQVIQIDSNSPYVESTSLKLVQYYKNGNSGEVCTDGSVSSGTVAREQSYNKDMNLSGIWFLQGLFVDADSGLKEIEYKGQKVITAPNETYNAGGAYFRPKAKENNPNLYDYEFQIPLGSNTENAVGRHEVSTHIVENTTTGLYDDQTFSVIYDNMAPVIITDKNQTPWFKFDEKVENSNGFYTFGSVATEHDVTSNNTSIAQSGVTKIAYYFTRDLDYNLYEKNNATYNQHRPSATNTRDLFDVMIYNSGNEADDVTSGNTIIDYEAKLSSSEGIYWRAINGEIRNSNQFIYSVNDPNIHNNGLIKINGVIYTIENLTQDGSSKLITLKGNNGDVKIDSGAVTAYIGLCNVIDKSGEKNGKKISTEKGYGYGYYMDNNSDDGDLVVESFTKQGTEWIFDAAVNSKNLPDGPITVHIIAFDAAGNFSTHTYEGTVSNNAPRIAGMQIGTDENGDGEVSEDEFIKTYSGKYTLGYDSSENIITQATFPTQNQSLGQPKSLLTVKGKTVMIPELVGGNGDLSYTYAVYNHKTGLEWEATAQRNVTNSVVLGSGTTDEVATLDAIELNIQDFIGTTNGQDEELISDGENKKFTFNFGDSTPGLTKDSGISNYASIDVIMNVLLRETDGAKTWIKPFYWYSSEKNSLFQNSTKKGHIELTSDIEDTDKKPKVSGLIKLEGIAQDNALLSSITVSFDKGFASQAANYNFEIATYNSATASWNTTPLTQAGLIPANGWASEISNATYEELIACGITLSQEDEAVIAQGAKTLQMSVPYNSQNYGHVVHWTMYLDTSKIANVAVKNVNVQAVAKDRGSPKWSTTQNGPVYTPNAQVVTNSAQTMSGGNTGTDVLSGKYQMDIVPYITKVYTSMAAIQKKEAKWSQTSRTAKGHYPVRVVTKDLNGNTQGNAVGGEEIKVYGFNFGANATYKPNAAGSIQLVRGEDVYGEYVTINANSLKAEANKASGAFSIWVNGVETINNNNNNDAKGFVTQDLSTQNYNLYAYNRLPNGDNNNLLTDDVYFDVWQFNNAAAIPISGKIEQPVMKIRPTDGKIGFAFVNGPLYFSMGGSSNREDYSYQYWMGSYDFFTSVGFTYDKLGYSYGVAAGGDINANEADKFKFMTSRWGSSDKYRGGSYGNNNSLRLESIAQSINGINVYDKQRIKSPSLVTSVTNNTTKVYLAYYDAMNDEIRFKSGTTNSQNRTNFGNFTDYDTDAKPYVYRNGTVAIIAGSNTNRNTGEYLSLGVIPNGGTNNDDLVCLVWYDATERALMYSYCDTPITNRAGNTQATGWSTPVKVFAEGSDMETSGEYCKVIADEDGGIHIACYDPTNLDLDYAYLPSTKKGKATAQSDFKTCIVDANGVVGSNLTLDVAKTGTNWVPYIGYYATSCIKPKYAYLTVSLDSEDIQGSFDDEYTGNWEITVVPTDSKIEMQSNQHNDINVGVWKNANGILQNSTAGTSVTVANGNSYGCTAYGQVFGNGTSNAVLGYAIKNGASSNNIETAQMK